MLGGATREGEGWGKRSHITDVGLPGEGKMKCRGGIY